MTARIKCVRCDAESYYEFEKTEITCPTCWKIAQSRIAALERENVALDYALTCARQTLEEVSVELLTKQIEDLEVENAALKAGGSPEETEERQYKLAAIRCILAKRAEHVTPK